MDRNYWLQRWKTNEIGFHKVAAHPLLTKYFDTLTISKGARVFIPLCGKSRDLVWLLSQGYRLVGAELSEMAVQQFFDELRISPEISTLGKLRRYSTESIEILAGDIFELSQELLGPIDAIYDRAALVALPEEMRQKYTAHLKQITGIVPQLLICYEYDQSLTEGPPFHVSLAELKRHYGEHYNLNLLSTTEVSGGIRGMVPAKETVYRLDVRKVSQS